MYRSLNQSGYLKGNFSESLDGSPAYRHVRLVAGAMRRILDRTCIALEKRLMVMR